MSAYKRDQGAASRNAVIGKGKRISEDTEEGVMLFALLWHSLVLPVSL